MVIRKNVKTALIALLVVTVTLTAAAAVLFWREYRDDSCDRASFALTVTAGDKVLWKGEKSGEVGPDDRNLTLTWKEKKTATVRILSGGAFLAQTTLAPGETKTLTVAVEREAPLTVRFFFSRR